MGSFVAAVRLFKYQEIHKYKNLNIFRQIDYLDAWLTGPKLIISIYLFDKLDYLDPWLREVKVERSKNFQYIPWNRLWFLD